METLTREYLNNLVGTKINNEKLYQRAFTHKSALKRYSNLDSSYETLEFIGDSVLGFIITKFLFDKFEKHQEGFLTKARTKLVRGKTLCEISKTLGLADKILMDEKGERNNWNTNENIMEDVFEALVGAIYLDLGVIHARNFVFRAFGPIIERLEDSLVDDNWKDQLMRWCQSLKYPLPEYRLCGQPNGQFFVMAVVDGLDCGAGFASTKKQAEQNAAQIVLKTDARFKTNDGGPPSRRQGSTPPCE